MKFKSNKHILNNFSLYLKKQTTKSNTLTYIPYIFTINFNDIYKHIYCFYVNDFYRFLLLDNIDYLLYIEYKEDNFSLGGEIGIIADKNMLYIFYEELISLNIVSLNNMVLKL